MVNTKEFENKVVLITGASSGIGAVTAVDFAKEGASVVIVARRAEQLAEVAALCVGPVKPLIIVADVCKDSERIISETINHFGRIDVLVNNVGRMSIGGIETSTVDQFDDMINVNVRSVYALTVIAVPHLLKTKGNIVNVSSLAGLRSYAGFLTYSMAKATLDQFTKCVALDLAPKGVRVNSVNPATIETNFLLATGFSEERAKMHYETSNAKHPLGRIGKPKEVSDAIRYLASDRASFVTGTLLAVDGGRTIQSV